MVDDNVIGRIRALRELIQKGDEDAFKKATEIINDLEAELVEREKELDRREKALEYLVTGQTGLEEIEKTINNLQKILENIERRKEQILSLLAQVPKLVTQPHQNNGVQHDKITERMEPSEEFWEHLLLIADFIALETREESLRRSEKALQERIKRELMKKKKE